MRSRDQICDLGIRFVIWGSGKERARTANARTHARTRTRTPTSARLHTHTHTHTPTHTHTHTRKHDRSKLALGDELTEIGDDVVLGGRTLVSEVGIKVRV